MKHVVIVGGSSGIGLALCQLLIKDNLAVTNISRTPCPVASVINITADVRDGKALDGAFEKIREADALVYCAGVSMAAPVECAAREDYRDLFDVNTLGAVDCIRLAMPILRRNDSAKILILGSSGGVAPIPFDSFYTASKAALVGLSRAVDLETDNVSCTTALIGGTRTQFSFKRNVYRDCADYEPKLKAATDALIKIEQNGCDAAKVAKKLYAILKQKHPAPVQTIGVKNKLMLLLYRMLPQCLADAAIRYMYFR